MTPPRDPAFLQALAEHNRRDKIAYSTLATVLSILVMPAGAIMDYYVYGPDKAVSFLPLRIASSLLVALVWLLFIGPLRRRPHHLFGVMWYLIPTVFIVWMIYDAHDPTSPYYAGLNIVLLALGVLSPWTYVQNTISAVLIVLMYVAACAVADPPVATAPLINNLYFLILTAIIVVAGSFLYNRQRHQEFVLRWELDKSRRTVEEAHRRLLQLDEAKSRFFANISHELRTPLTLMLAPLETLLHQTASPFDDATRALLRTMLANGMRLLKLINDLLDLVRIESGTSHVKREPIHLPSFIDGLLSAVRHLADDKQLHLSSTIAEDIGIVMADRDKLEKILLNLQFNALKFTPPGGRIHVRAAKADHELVLSVADTGMGISEQNLGSVFSRFWQADDTVRRKYQGMGIGLALVKELTEVQGGCVAVESREGQGSTFTVRLPYIAPDPNAAPDPAPQPASLSPATASPQWLATLYRRAELFPALTPIPGRTQPRQSPSPGHLPKILIADDEPDMLRFLASQLQPHYQILEAADGQQAVDKAVHFLPDLILLDMMMPEKDGLQASRELRRHTATHGLPILMLTARADEETKLAALSAGANDFLPKPFSTTELHVRVKNLVESHQYQRRLSRQNQVLEHTIEQLKETEIQLVQTEKLASLGRLSAGIIHEINNPLNYVTTSLFTLRQNILRLPPEPRADYEDVLSDIDEGIQRVKTIVADLRAFAHRDDASAADQNVADAVTVALRFLSREWRGQVRIEQDLPPGFTVHANRNRLLHVLVNLLQNSLDAIREKSFADEHPTIWITGERHPHHLALRIRDNGQGIAAEHLDKIFDPFFTTKDVGKGMGLGLSICYRIVQQCGGHIAVKSDPGKYSEFTVTFPVKTGCEAA
ncbi:MAG: response regulator [Verrucomicrobia bacterium]|nr:response regulator [Verrucomicrobiota bacterium]